MVVKHRKNSCWLSAHRLCDTGRSHESWVMNESGSSHQYRVNKRVFNRDSGVISHKSSRCQINLIEFSVISWFMSLLFMTSLLFLPTNNNSNWSGARFSQFGSWFAVSHSSISVADQNCGCDSSGTDIWSRAAATDDFVAHLNIQMFYVTADSQPKCQRCSWWILATSEEQLCLCQQNKRKKNYPNIKWKMTLSR